MVLFYRNSNLSRATPWCNGSTTGFGPVSLSSNLGGVAIFFWGCHFFWGLPFFLGLPFFFGVAIFFGGVAIFLGGVAIKKVYNVYHIILLKLHLLPIEPKKKPQQKIYCGGCSDFFKPHWMSCIP